MSSKPKILVPKLVRDTINDLNEKLATKNDYIKILEAKIGSLQEKLYFIERNKHMEEVVEDVTITHNVEEGLKKMGIDAEDLDELGDMLDEVLGKEDNEK